MNFAQVMSDNANIKTTENGALAHSSLNNSLLELFAQIGALRPRTEQEIEDKFAAAFNQDRLLATKMLFYAGNIRGGLGERRTFHICLKWLARHHPSIVKANLKNIPHYNRWDSLFVLVNTPAEANMWQYVYTHFWTDWHAYRQGRPCSLLAKWLPSENASSKHTKELALRAASAFHMTPRNYRKAVSQLRAHIKVVERSMSANEWREIEYSAVPSYAMKNYSNAFQRHDKNRFEQYRLDVADGKQKVNASTLYPYDIVKNFTGYQSKENLMAEEQWKALPNYVEGENNVVVMADVSGSMGGRPMDTSVGLAIYFAERNNGPYQNLYMTFTDKPHFIKIDPNYTLRRKVNQVMSTDVGYNTNLERAFLYILEHAVKSGVKYDEMPKAIVVISDMEIDSYMCNDDDYGYDWSFINEMRRQFEIAGYSLPKIVLWNVEARNDTFLHNSDDVIFVSGQSPSAFKSFLGALNGETAWDVMLRTLNDKIYDRVVI